MNETEHLCVGCKRFLTEEEVAFGRNVQKRRISEIFCWYCHTAKLLKMREALPTQADIPLPPPEEFGRPGAEIQKKAPQSNKNSSDKNPQWPDEVTEQLKRDFGHDPNESLEAKGRRLKHMGDKGPSITKVTSNGQKYTFIAAYGANEDVSLTFRVPRDLMEKKLEDAIGAGLNNILRSLMNMLTFAPLHGGIMENILRPSPQNPMMGPPPGFPPGD